MNDHLERIANALEIIAKHLQSKAEPPAYEWNALMGRLNSRARSAVNYHLCQSIHELARITYNQWMGTPGCGTQTILSIRTLLLDCGLDIPGHPYPVRSILPETTTSGA